MRSWLGFHLIFLLAVSVERGVSDNRDCCIEAIAENCQDLLSQGETLSGWYTIYPTPGKAMVVFCDMETDGGGWLVFQRRIDGSVPFYRGWGSYKRGFGNQTSEFWLGNDKLHLLTSLKPQQLRIDLEDFNDKWTNAKYSSFKIENEDNKYKLNVKSYLGGNMGDSLTNSKGMYFSTMEKDNDIDTTKNCAEIYKGAWWYRKCHAANLNGPYLKGEHTTYGDGMNWSTGKGYHYSYKSSEMKIRPE